jgi:hypothetical protein
VCLSGNILKGSVTFISIKLVFAPVAHKEVLEAIIVIVPDANPLSPTALHKTRLPGDVFKGTVSFIPVQVIDRLLAIGKSFEGITVHLEDVQPAVVVIIEKSHAAARRFQKIFVALLASKNCRCVKTRLSGDVGKSKAKGFWGLFRNYCVADSPP